MGTRRIFSGVTLTHPDRVLWPDLGLTKADLARYHQAVAPHILPHVIDRPLTLVRCPEGLAAGCFYMKHSNVRAPDALRRVAIRERSKVGEYLIIDDLDGLLAVAQMSVIEIHTWMSHAAELEHPDRIILDLDPGPRVGWPQVVRAARLVRSACRVLGLESWVKTTGGAGLHVVVPIVPELPWDETFAFSRTLAEAIARHHPDEYTTNLRKDGREDKIFIDYLRNHRGSTAVAAFSPRARPGAPVSMPIAWDELSPRLDPARFTLRTVPDRLARLRRDPWASYFKARQRLAPRIVEAVATLD